MTNCWIFFHLMTSSSLVLSFVHSFLNIFLHSFSHFIIPLFLRSSLPPFIHSFLPLSFILSFLLSYFFRPSFISSFLLSCLHSLLFSFRSSLLPFLVFILCFVSFFPVSIFISMICIPFLHPGFSYCGSAVPTTFQSQGRTLLLVFISDGETEAAGLSLVYQFLPAVATAATTGKTQERTIEWMACLCEMMMSELLAVCLL